jgi:hypothetical protein
VAGRGAVAGKLGYQGGLPVRRWFALGGAVMLVGLAGATPAFAEQIGITAANDGPVPPDANRAVQVVAGAGENNHVTVRATDPSSVVDPTTGTTGWPLTVTVTDSNATFDPTPPTGDLSCQVIDAHTARCAAPAGTDFTQAVVELGDGNNQLQFAADTQPLREQFTAGDGNNDVSTGPFAGDASYRWASYAGGGNDTVRIGPVVRNSLCGSPLTGLPCGLALQTGAGNDTIYAANGAFDEVNCGDGNDTLYADPWDSESLYTEPQGSCETRILPAVG